MFKKETFVYIGEQLAYRSKHPTRGDKWLTILLLIATGCFAFCLFAVIGSGGSALWGWLYYLTFAVICFLVVGGSIWRIYDIIKHMK